MTVPYPSRLTDDAGQPLNGEYAFTFAVYDAPADGQLVVVGNADRSGSSKTAILPSLFGDVNLIPNEVAVRKELWLAVSVRGPGETTFTLLTPGRRFTVQANRGSALTCPHSHFNDSWSWRELWQEWTGSNQQWRRRRYRCLHLRYKDKLGRRLCL